MDRVILHVGPAKTGTTAIQAMLAKNQEVLAKAGFWYPMAPGENDQEGHPTLAWELLERCGESPVRLTRSALTFDMALEQARQAKAHTLVLSSEDFSHPRVDDTVLAQLRKMLGGADMTVIYGARNPRHLIPSLWQQAVKWGLGGGEEQLEFEDAAPDLIDRYRRSAELYLQTAREVLAPVAVRALIVPSSSRRQELSARFITAAGLEAAELDLTNAPASANPSLGYSKLRLLLELNRTAPIRAEPLDRAALVAREFIVRQLHNDTGVVDPLPIPANMGRLLSEFRLGIRELVSKSDYVGDIADLDDANDVADIREAASVSPASVLNSAMIKLAEYAHWAEDCASHLSRERDSWRERAEQMTLRCCQLEEAVVSRDPRRRVLERLFSSWKAVARAPRQRFASFENNARNEARPPSSPHS